MLKLTTFDQNQEEVPQPKRPTRRWKRPILWVGTKTREIMLLIQPKIMLKQPHPKEAEVKPEVVVKEAKNRGCNNYNSANKSASATYRQLLSPTG
jgi:hypothetical protein